MCIGYEAQMINFGDWNMSGGVLASCSELLSA